MLKKIGSCLLVWMMILSLGLCWVSAEDDITGTAYETPVRVLAALGILGGYPDGTFQPEARMTRAECATVIARILFAGELPAAGNETIYQDVPVGYWAAGSINALARAGVVDTYVEGFRPEEAVTYYQVIKMLLHVMGYGDVALRSGGYPDGYLYIATLRGMLRDTQGTNDSVGTTRGTIARLLYNALEVPFLESGIETTGQDGPTILSRMQVYKGQGTVAATEVVALEGYNKAPRGSVIIVDSTQSIEAEVGNSDVASAFGQTVTYYIKEGDDRDVVLYARGPGGSDMLYINGKSIVTVDKTSITYTDDDYRDITETFAEDLKVVYNGTEVEATDKTPYLQPKIGSVTLLHIDGSSGYNMAYVTDYEAYVVEKAIAAESRIVFKPSLGTLSSLDVSRYDEVSILRDGAPATLDQLAPWDVVHVARGLEEKKVEIVASSTNVLSGTITEMSGDRVYVNGAAIEIDLAVVEDNLYGALRLGDAATLYYNDNGVVFAYQIGTSAGKQYAYLFKMDSKGSLGGNVSVKLYTTDGLMQILPIADNVSLNDDRMTAEDFYNSPVWRTQTVVNGVTQTVFYDQLVEYATNSEGEISKVKTAKDIKTLPGGELGYNEQEFTLVMQNEIDPENPANSKYVTMDKFNGCKFGETYLAMPTTRVIMVPDTLEDEFFTISTVNDAFPYKDDKNIDGGMVMLYNADRFMQVPLVVYKTDQMRKGGSNQIETNSSVFIVDQLSQGVDSEGNVKTVLNGLYEGETISLRVSTSVSLDMSKLVEGAVIQYKLDKNGEIIAVRVLGNCRETDTTYVRSMDNKAGENSTAGWIDNLLVFCGDVYGKSDSGEQLVISTGQDWDHYRGFYAKGARVYVYNKSKERLSVGSMDDLVATRNSPVRVLFRSYRSAIKDLIIIEE